MFLFGKPSISRELRRRKITLLLHSTHLYKNLPKILEDGEIRSAGALRKQYGANQAARFLHDPNRYEKFTIGLDYINCSLTEPNFELLYKRSKSGWEAEWVHFALNLDLLLLESTLFCAFSAARRKGEHIQDGIEGFQSLFDETVDTTNRAGLGNNLPTHPQAEVLIKGPLPLSDVKAIHVYNQPIHDEVVRLCERHQRDIPVTISPHLFIWPARLIKK
jgi:hypothetical protein